MSRNTYIGFFFAVFIITTAVTPPPGLNEENLIPLWGPLERIRADNRWICTAFASGLIAMCLNHGSRFAARGSGSLVILLLALHSLILVKNVAAVGLVALFYFTGLIVMISATRLVAGKTVADQPPGKTDCWKPLVVASFGFLAANLLQYLINPAATMVVSNRFSGITCNPQMYALATAVLVPALLFQYANDHRLVSRAIVLFAFFVLVFFVVLSGSRLSLLLSAFSVLMFYRAKLAQLAKFALPVVLLAVLFLMFGENLPLDPESRIASTTNTRSDVWQRQVDGILAHPIFGQQLEAGQRLGFGENSYLAAGVAVGLPGLFLVLGVAFLILRQLLSLMQLEHRLGWRPELALPIAVLSACLLGAFFEAFLLGIFTLPLTALLYTVFISEAMIQRLSHRPATAPTSLPPQFQKKRKSRLRFSPAVSLSRYSGNRQVTSVHRPYWGISPTKVKPRPGAPNQ